MSLNEDQVRALASLAEALKGTTIEELIKANVNVLPQADSSASALKDLESTTTPTSGVQSLLALHADVSISRDINTHASYFVPSFSKQFFILNSMDSHLSNNFYARRAMPNFFPTITRLYMSIIDIIQVLRCMKHARSIDTSTLAFLEDFLEQFPPETLPVPGPLLVTLKAICISFPENSNLRRVVPALPQGYPKLPRSATNASLIAYTPTARFIDTNHIDWMIPYPSYIAHLHHLMMEDHPGTLTLGANDSGSATAHTKTVTSTALPQYPQIVDLLLHPKKSVRQEYFPFPVTPAAATVPNATTDEFSAAQRTILGTDRSDRFTNVNVASRQAFTKLGLNEPIRVNYDLISQFKKAFSSLDIPNPDLDETVETVAEALLLNNSMEWFAQVAAMMSVYCRFFPDSGSLSDASVEGPKIGQYICHIKAPTPALDAPTYFADPAMNIKFDHNLATTISRSEKIIEMTAAYACINIDAQNVYSYVPTLSHTASRRGPFWDTRPIYDVSTLDTAWIKLDQAIQRQIKDRPEAEKK